jgi:hypothetical protein
LKAAIKATQSAYDFRPVGAVNQVADLVDKRSTRLNINARFPIIHQKKYLKRPGNQTQFSQNLSSRANLAFLLFPIVKFV